MNTCAHCENAVRLDYNTFVCGLYSDRFITGNHTCEDFDDEKNYRVEEEVEDEPNAFELED